MKNKAQAFTFVEILIAVICVGMIVSMGGLSFKKAREAHQVDTFVQELLLLRSAFLGYYEMHQCMPKYLTHVSLEHEPFRDIKPFWYPFHSNSSQVVKNGQWWGGFEGNDLDKVYIYLRTEGGSKFVRFTTAQMNAIRNKINNAFLISERQGAGIPFCYIFKKP